MAVSQQELDYCNAIGLNYKECRILHTERFYIEKGYDKVPMTSKPVIVWIWTHNFWFCRYKNSPYGTSGASPYEAWLHFQYVSEKNRTVRDK